MPTFETVTLIRDLALLVNASVVLYSVLLGTIFVLQWYRASLRKIVDSRIAWALFMYGMAINSFGFIQSDIYFITPAESTFWAKFAYVGLFIAISGFSFGVENIVDYRTFHIPTGLLLVMGFFAALLPREQMIYTAYVGYVVMAVLLFMFIRYYRNITVGEVKKNIGQIWVAFLIGIIGYIGKSDMVFYNLGPATYIISGIILVISLIVLGLIIIGSPALNELDWEEYLMELYILQSTGVLMHHHTFKSSVSFDEGLTAAGIAGIQNLFQELLITKEGLNHLTVGEYSVLFVHGDGILAVLISTKPYTILLDKLQDFTEKFQLVYQKEIEEYDGERGAFQESSDLIKLVFAS
ncbi:MAG: hypothetical protein GF411_03300 [Candidatus Lokiarchaeota archaeon]|nr:hypothetical protein [Candidatus Lokiarchaeota archaeon]